VTQLSVIIAAFNAAETIQHQLQALERQQWSQLWEVIVADNGSSDGTARVVQGYQGRLPRLCVVDASDKRGAAHSRNVGARAAQGTSLAFCDADDEVGEGWLPAIGGALERYEFVASRFDTEKLNPTWIRRSHGNPQRDGLNQYTYPPFLPHAGGGGLAIRRSVFEALGGFDESLLRLQDTDLCWRVQLSGVPLHFVPEAVYHVRYRDSLAGLYRQAMIFAEYNVLLYKRYRAHGMPPLSWRTSAAAWLGLIRRLLRIRSRGQLVAWTWQLAWRLGRVRGSLRYRVWGV
jgi:glycosyltransferase involved in cell wall biosynthesis